LIRGGTESNGVRLPPPQERLFAGGATSVRGYQQNQLGELVYVITKAGDIDSTFVSDTTFLYTIKGTGVQPERPIPIGGNSLIVTNVDLRFGDPFFPELIQYTLFTDVGGVWTRRSGETSSLFSELVRQLRYTPGVGVRVFSPVGPIQANLGYNPYNQRSGATYYAPETATGFSALYCVTPSVSTAIPIHKTAAGLVQETGTCPSSFAPTPSSAFFRRLTFTISIGADF
jgi:outer membrane protein insertion porin family/translocation and assembly module TamA